MKKLILFLSLFLFSLPAISGPFYFSLAARGGMGKGGSVDGEFTETRDMWVFGGEATLGLFLGRIMIGGNAEYNLWKQKTDVEEAGGTNISGTQLNLSPAIAIPLGRFMFQVKTPLHSTFKMDRKSAADEETEYTTPVFPPYSLMIAYSLGKSYIGVEYSKIEYKKLKHGGDEFEMDEDARLSLSSIGVVYGYKF